MMFNMTPFLTLILVIGTTQFKDGLSLKQGCLSGKQAESLNEEILRLFEEAPLVEALEELTSKITADTFSHLEPCFDIKVFLDVVAKTLEALGHDTSGVTKLYEENQLKGIRTFADSYKKIITPLVEYAEQVEQKVKEGNQRRQTLLYAASSFKDIWQYIRLIQKEHQKTLQALDIFLKDSILRKSAEIGQYVREGNKNGRWTVSKVKQELTKEMDRAFKMLQIFKGSNRIESMVNEMAENYVVSQVYSALQKSKLENAMLRDSHINWRFERFSEVTISESLRKVSTLLYDSMAIGMDLAEKYHNEVNQTVKSVSEGMKNIESIPLTSVSNCKTTLDIIRISAALLLQSGTFQIVFGPLVTASNYQREIETFSTARLFPTINEVSIIVALTPIMQSVQIDEATSAKLGDTVHYLNDFARGMNVLNLDQTNETLAQVSVYMKQLLEVFQCQRKSIQLVGRIIQGCIDGRDDFEGLYERHNSDLSADLTKCSETWAIDVPSKSVIQTQVQYASTSGMFNFKFPSCRQNQQQDDPGYVYDADHEYDDDDEDVKRLSATQRMMVCDLRKRSKTQTSIAQLIKMDEKLIASVRCKLS